MISFTFDGYRDMISLIKEKKYEIVTYKESEKVNRAAILRHDVDFDIYKAHQMAFIEKEECVRSTYFVLVTSDFYNILSLHNKKMLREIAECGHEIGLHFDEMCCNQEKDYLKSIKIEADILSSVIEKKVEVVSMHRPSKGMLDANLQIPGMVNTYSNIFFKGYKYISDSRRKWRESPKDIISHMGYDKLHILTHPFWYNDKEIDIRESLMGLLNGAKIEKYRALSENITDINSIIKEEDV